MVTNIHVSQDWRNSCIVQASPKNKRFMFSDLKHVQYSYLMDTDGLYVFIYQSTLEDFQYLSITITILDTLAADASTVVSLYITASCMS